MLLLMCLKQMGALKVILSGMGANYLPWEGKALLERLHAGKTIQINHKMNFI